jgi:hypothetical protein
MYGLNRYIVKNGGVVEKYYKCDHANNPPSGENTSVDIAIYPTSDKYFYMSTSCGTMWHLERLD